MTFQRRAGQDTLTGHPPLRGKQLMSLPNFLGIGVQRAATTWLHCCLEEHPQVFVPAEKELHFFSHHFDKGVAWYEGQFAASTGRKAVGEITPTYLHEASIARIATLLPDAKLIVVLRDPVERMLSAYRLFQETFRNMSFQEACESSDYLITRSLYADRLREVFDRFPRERIRVYLYDDVQEHPLGILADVFNYLDVDSTFVPKSALKVFNRGVFPGLQKALERVRMSWVVDIVKSTGLADSIKRRSLSNRRAVDKSNSSDYERDLRKRIFRGDLLKVQDLIDRDLSAWM